jgi:hypothetical protein
MTYNELSQFIAYSFNMPFRLSLLPLPFPLSFRALEGSGSPICVHVVSEWYQLCAAESCCNASLPSLY